MSDSRSKKVRQMLAVVGTGSLTLTAIQGAPASAATSGSAESTPILKTSSPHLSASQEVVMQGSGVPEDFSASSATISHGVRPNTTVPLGYCQTFFVEAVDHAHFHVLSYAWESCTSPVASMQVGVVLYKESGHGNSLQAQDNESNQNQPYLAAVADWGCGSAAACDGTYESYDSYTAILPPPFFFGPLVGPCLGNGTDTMSCFAIDGPFTYP